MDVRVRREGHHQPGMVNVNTVSPNIAITVQMAVHASSKEIACFFMAVLLGLAKLGQWPARNNGLCQLIT
jgi:hypothetical protein